MLRSVILCAAALALTSCAAAPASPQADAAAPILVSWEGADFREGDSVRIHSRAGTFKPADTGYPTEVVAGPGQTGVAVSAHRRTPPLRADEPLQVLRVRFAPQAWVSVSGERVALGAFEATIHADYLEIVE